MLTEREINRLDSCFENKSSVAYISSVSYGPSLPYASTGLYQVPFKGLPLEDWWTQGMTSDLVCQSIGPMREMWEKN